MRPIRRRGKLDFSDYLEVRRLRDAGEGNEEVDLLLLHLEEALPVPFVDAIPNLVTLADAPIPPPRGLTRDAVRVLFQMREEFARHGATRRALSGFPLPDGEGLKDWLDFMEAERKNALATRGLLRELDGKIWRVYTGERRMPLAGPLPLAGPG